MPSSAPTRYHVNANNQARPCGASQRACRYGTAHYRTEEEANTAIAQGTVKVVLPVRKTTSVAGGRSDTSRNETLAINAIVAFSQDEKKDFNKLVTDIANLPEEKKMRVYRGVPTTFIHQSLENLYQTITELENNDNITLLAPRGNKNGSDLEVVESENSYEVKFGSATDAAIGVNPLTTIVGRQTALLLPTKEDRLHWRKLYLVDAEAQKLAHDTKLRNFVKTFEERSGEALATNPSRLIHAYFNGITNAVEALDPNITNARKITRLVITEDGTWKQGGRDPIDVTAPWHIGHAEWTDKARARFSFTHEEGWETVLTHNYKNHYYLTRPDGQVEKVRPTQGLGTLSFNLWFRPAK